MKVNDLIERGYLPVELIPPFTSDSFASNIKNIEQKILGFNNPKKGKCITLSVPRIQTSRRRLSIPNPYHQLKLCEEIANNWTSIKPLITKSKLSLTKPVISTNPLERAIEKANKYSEITVQKALKSFSAKYMIKVDISRFYGTVYTHIIPWVIHGKEKAKKEHGPTLLGNRIDVAIRNAQDGQTLGIPIGPDTSFLIAELVANKVDEQLFHKSISPIQGFRYIDDYYFFCQTVYEAEQIISTLSEVLSEYELELNPTKTEIINLPIELETKWIGQLRLYQFSSIQSKQKIDLLNYFSQVFSFVKDYPNDFVIKYAITRIKNKQFHEDNWRIYESLLLQSIIAEPSVLPIVLEIFLKYQRAGYKLHKNDIRNTIYTMLEYHIKYNHTFEILWLLWYSRSLNIKLNKEMGNKLVKIDCPLVGLIVIDLQNIGLLSKNLSKTIWHDYMNEKHLYTNNWIFAYEAYIKKYVPYTNNYVDNDQFFKALKTYNVSFYDPNRQIKIDDFEKMEDEFIFKLYEIINKIEEKLVDIHEYTEEMNLISQSLRDAYNNFHDSISY